MGRELGVVVQIGLYMYIQERGKEKRVDAIVVVVIVAGKQPMMMLYTVWW